MKDPVRWRDTNSEADGEVRALLASGEADSPSDSQRKRIWAGLAPQIQILPAPPPVASVAASGTAALVGKIALGVALVSAVGTGVHVARSRTRAPAPAPAAAVRATAPIAPEIARPAVSPIVEPVAPSASRPALARPAGHRPRAPLPGPAAAKPVEMPEPPTVQSPPVVVSNELLEEGRRLSRARAALRAHDPEEALRLLQFERAGAAGLAQEREALTIEALWSQPASRGEAERRARTFMTAYPDSPYRARIKALVLAER